MDNNSAFVKITDLGLASALISSGFRLCGTHPNQNNRIYFLFEPNKKLSFTIEAYVANTLNVKARTFFDNTKMLKGMIYAERGSP